MGWESWNELVDPANRIETTKKNNRPSSISKPTHIVLHITGTDDFNSVKNRFTTQSASAHYLVKTDGTQVQFVRDKDRAWHAGIQSYVRSLYDDGTDGWKKYLRYFGWYTYPEGAKYLKEDLSPATSSSERKLVAQADGDDWPHYAYWTRHGNRKIPLNYENNTDPNNYSIGIEMLTVGGQDNGAYPDGLYEGSAKLIRNLVDKYGIPVDREHIVGHEDVNPVERWGWDPNSGFDRDRLFDLIGAPPGGFVFPVDIGAGTSVTDTSVEKFFKHNEKEHNGGYFPLGANTVWHGGVHIHVPPGAKVRAIADGVVVAAKLAETEELANGHYGSHNFILVKHPITGRVLNNQFKGSGADEEGGGEKTRKLAQGETLEQLAEDWGTTVRKIRDANTALEDADHFGQNSSGTKSWYWEGDTVVRPAEEASSDSGGDDSSSAQKFDDEEVKYFYSLYMHLGTEVLSQEDNEKLEAFEWLPRKIVKENIETGDTHSVKAGEKLEDLADEWRTTVDAIKDSNPELDFGQNSAGTVSWFHPGDTVKRPAEEKEKVELDEAFLKSLKSGDIIKVADAKVGAGDVIWSSGKYGTDPVGMLHWEIFSEENLFPSFVAVEDDDDDCNMDSEKIFNMVEQGDGWFNDKGNLSAEEVIDFYTRSDKAPELRRYACKFVSEWAMDIDTAISRMKGRFFTTGLKERLEPYVWWHKAAAKGVDLPSARHVWHYNPIMVLSELHGETTKNGAKSSSEPSAVESATKLSQRGRELLQEVEGLRLQPYDDQTGQTIDSWVEGATIGYGHLIPRSEWSLWSGGISEEQAEQLFAGDLAPFENAVSEHVEVSLSQQQFDALVIFVYNIGIGAFSNSSALALINSPESETPYESLEDAWKAWNKSQGEVMPGLINRRKAEWSLYSDGVYETW